MVQANVKCIHPDRSSMYSTYSIGYEESDIFLSEEEYRKKEKKREEEIRTFIELKENKNGYWHEIEIKLAWFVPTGEGTYLQIKKEI